MAKQINLQQMPGETLQDLYTRLAKTADQRLVRLEKLSSQEGFQTAREWSYARAIKDIEKWNAGKEYKEQRFNRSMPKNEAQLKAKINDIRTFLQAPSSTKQGIVDIYKKRAETVNKKYGTSFTWEDLAKFYLKGMNKKLEKEGGSDTILRAIGIIQSAKHPEEWVSEAWNNTRRAADQRVSLIEDPVMDKVVQSLLRKRSLKELLDI